MRKKERKKTQNTFTFEKVLLIVGIGDRDLSSIYFLTANAHFY